MDSARASEKGKLVLAVAIFLIAAGALGTYLFRREPATGAVQYVCVATGQRFSLSREQATQDGIPATNPKTGERTLLPCYQDNGDWYVMRRYGEALEQLGEQNHYVEPDTLKVRKSR